MALLKVFGVLTLITVGSFHNLEAKSRKDLDSSLSKHEVSKVYAQKIIDQYGQRGTLRIQDFEKLLTDLEDESTKSKVTSCVDGMKILREIESADKNLSKSFLIDVEHMITVCPILLYHVSNQSLMNQNKCLEPTVSAKKIESRTLVWVYSTLALIGISLCGLFGVIVIPIVDKNYYFFVLQFFMALAVGTLTGDALLHLLPHAMRPKSDDMSPAELLEMMMHRGIAAVVGIMSFCLIERLLSVVTKLKNKGQKQIENTLNGESQGLQKHSHKHGHSHGPVDTQSESLSSIVWMVILGDGLHNFTDGMAIGAAFSNNIAGGFSTAVAVFCHELPHELGDFAVLLKAGMSARKAIFYNILSSVLSFLGMCVGILLGDTPETTQWVFAAAAGLFIYIALVDMVTYLPLLII